MSTLRPTGRGEATTSNRGLVVDPGVLGYRPGLDGLRALAALVVVGLHANIPGFTNGWLGVDVFFTLSGFLITSILLRDIHRFGRPRYKTFYVRRALRLLPAYCAVVVAAVIGDLVIDVGGTLKGAVVSAVYMANWAAAAGMGLGSLGHTWSLSIEEQFYFVWPTTLAVVAWVAARTGRSATRLVALLMIASYVLTLVALALGVSERVLWNATPARAVQLFAGAVLALGFEAVRRRAEAGPWVRWAGVVGLVGLLGCLVVPQDDFGAIVLGWPLVAAFTCAVVASVVVGGGGSTERMLAWRPLVVIGRASYGLYLWHYLVLTSVDAAVGLDTWGPRLAGIALTGLVTWASYVFIEQPFLRRKDRVAA
jgi:peptidoglycan/LPS O-acetylase OafA/YrhL